MEKYLAKDATTKESNEGPKEEQMSSKAPAPSTSPTRAAPASMPRTPKPPPTTIKEATDALLFDPFIHSADHAVLAAEAVHAALAASSGTTMWIKWALWSLLMVLPRLLLWLLSPLRLEQAVLLRPPDVSLFYSTGILQRSITSAATSAAAAQSAIEAAAATDKTGDGVGAARAACTAMAASRDATVMRLQIILALLHMDGPDLSYWGESQAKTIQTWITDFDLLKTSRPERIEFEAGSVSLSEIFSSKEIKDRLRSGKITVNTGSGCASDPDMSDDSSIVTVS